MSGINTSVVFQNVKPNGASFSRGHFSQFSQVYHLQSAHHGCDGQQRCRNQNQSSCIWKVANRYFGIHVCIALFFFKCVKALLYGNIFYIIWSFVRGSHRSPFDLPYNGQRMQGFDDFLPVSLDAHIGLVNSLRPRPTRRHFADNISNAFSRMKMNEFRLGFHWNLFLMYELTIIQHWFR